MIMPRSLYFAIGDFGPKSGLGFTSDPHDNVDSALDAAVDGRPFRLYRVDFHDNGLPECIRDITEDAIAERNEWLRGQGRAPIEVAA